MQVSTYSHNKNQTSFGSKRIMSVIVRDRNNRPVKAWFTRLKLSNPDDLEAMEKVNQEWDKYFGVEYAIEIYKKFLNGKHVVAIELDSEKPLYERLLCLAAFHTTKDKFHLKFLQASPNSCFEVGNNRKYKGAGTALVYGLVSIAKKIKATMFQLESYADEFYKDLGMTKKGLLRFFDQAQMADFLKRQKAKWKALSEKSV